MPIDPSFLTSTAEWRIGDSTAPAAAGPSTGGAAPAGQDFGGLLAQQLGHLEQLQGDAAGAAQALASGQASDPESVVMAVERARLAMQLASQIRTKSVEAIQDVFHTQV
jgi:flagellar hook-basal body complex protein FliE